jgi:hypothetical protein
MSMIVRDARWSDVGELVALIQERRRELEAFDPRFWRSAGQAAAHTRRFYRWLLLTGRGALLLAEEEGRVIAFLTARRVKAPPVYDPGGITILIDDFCVATPQLWPSAGSLLLEALRSRGRQRGWRQMVVAAPAADQVELDLLRRHELTHTSSWWTGPF